MRAAIEREIAGRGADVDGLQERIVATLDRLTRELRSIRLRQQAECAFLDSSCRVARVEHHQAVARGRARSERSLKSVGMGMNGDSQVAITS